MSNVAPIKNMTSPKDLLEEMLEDHEAYETAIVMVYRKEGGVRCRTSYAGRMDILWLLESGNRDLKKVLLDED